MEFGFGTWPKLAKHKWLIVGVELREVPSRQSDWIAGEGIGEPWQRMEAAWFSQSQKDDLRLRREAACWMGTEAGSLGAYGFKGAVMAQSKEVRWGRGFGASRRSLLVPMLPFPPRPSIKTYHKSCPPPAAIADIRTRLHRSRAAAYAARRHRGSSA